jgi:hypothetical protein
MKELWRWESTGTGRLLQSRDRLETEQKNVTMHKGDLGIIFGE